MKKLKKHTEIAIKNFLELLFIGTCIIILTFWFLGQPFIVDGDSMLPNFENQQQLVAEKISYKLENPRRGQVVILSNPKTKDLILKRIIGLPGDIFKIEEGSVYINGDILEEPYLDPNTMTNPKNFLKENKSIKIPENKYILLGDNRENSTDSRNWGFADSKDLVGKVLIIYSPIKDFRLVQQP